VYQPNHFNRVREVINLYRSDPRSFNDEEIDELQELANDVGITFNPVRNELNMANIAKTAMGGFVEGLTTLPVGQKPRTTYEAIAHSLGHLVGFAPSILAGPLGLATKGTAKLGLKTVSKGLEKGVKASQLLDKISIPMVASRATKKGVDYGLKKSGLESLEFMQRGAKTRGIFEEAAGLGSAVAVSSIWKGPDAMLDGWMGGAIAGGAFGGIGNFVSIGNRLKMGNASQRKTAEKALRGTIGATVLGLPSYLRDEPIEMVIYETLLGGFFGYNARPSHEVEGGKFIQRSLYGAKKGRVFYPEGSKIWNEMHPKAQGYIKDQSTDLAKTWLYKNFDPKWANDIVENDVVSKAKDVTKISEADRDASYRNLAYELYKEQAPDKGKSIPVPPNLESDIEDGIYREESTNDIVYTDIVGMMKEIGSSIQKVSGNAKITPKQVASDINQTFKASKNADDFIGSLKKSPLLGKSIDKKMERRYRQFYHNRSKAPKNVYTATIDENGAKLEVLNGRWEGKKIGSSMVDMPVHYLDPNGKHTALTHIKVKRGDNWQIVSPFKTSMIWDADNFRLVSERSVTGDEYFQMEYNLHKGNKYIHGGKKDNTEMWIRNYHEDGLNIRPEELINLLARDPKEKVELINSLKDSRSLADKWYDMHRTVYTNKAELDGRLGTIRSMHDKAWVSNVLVMAERNGLHTTGKPLTKTISKLMDSNFGKNVIDFNKREQMLYDQSIPQDPTVYSQVLPEGKLRYIVLNDAENNSKTDGSVIMRRDVFDKGINNMGLPEKSGMLKSVFVDKNYHGLIHVKNGTRRANDKWEKYLNDNKIDAVFFASAVKQKGALKPANYTYNKKSGNIEVTQDTPSQGVSEMPVQNFRINSSTYESDKLGGVGIVRQMSSLLNHTQTPGMAKYFFDTIIKPSLEGEPNFNVKYKTDKDIMNGLNTDPDFVFKMPIKEIQKHIKEDTPLARRIRKQIIKLDEEGQLFDYGDSDFGSFHERNLRLLRLSDANHTTSNFDKYGYKYWEPTYRRFIVSRYMQPKWKSSSKAVLIPNTPDMPTVKQGRIRLDDGQRRLPVTIEGMPSIKTLGQLYDLYTAKNTSAKIKKQLSPHMDLTVVRVPADSISGIRILRLDGFTGERGFGALTSPKDDVYLGGADKDIDSVFIYHGFDKKIKNAYGKKENKNEWEGKDAKSNDDLFVKGSKKEQDIYKTVSSKFSPSMRKSVAESAVRGKDGLGFGLTAKNVVMEWADIVARNGGTITLPMISKKSGQQYATLELKLKENGHAKLREIGRDVVNYSADSADYPNMASPVEYRDILFNSVFEATKKPYGKAKWSPEKGTFQHTKSTELGIVNELITFINPKGKDYTLGKAHTIHDLSNFLNKFEKNDRGIDNIHSHIARQMIKDGVHKQLESNYNLLEMGDVGNIPVDKNADKLTGIKDLNPITRKQLDKIFEKGGNPLDKVRDFVYKNIFSIVSKDTIAKRAMDLVNQLKTIELAPSKMQKMLNNIREEAMRIKALTSNDPNQFDSLVRTYKLQLANDMAKVKLDPKIAHELLDMWLLSPFQSISNGKVTKTQVSTLPIESDAISDSAIRKMQTNLNEYVRPSQPPKKVPESKPKEPEIPFLTDKLERMAITEKDAEIVAEFRTNLEKNPMWKKHFRDMFTEFTMLSEGIPRDETTIKMNDLYALNNYMKNMRSYPDSPELQKSVYYNDLREVDNKMKKFDLTVFPQYQTTVITKDGPVKRTVKRSFSTLGTMRNWLHKVFYQQDAVLESIDPINDEIFKFRKELNVTDAGMINELVYKLRDMRRRGLDWNDIYKDKLYIKNKNRKFLVDKKNMTLEEIITKTDKDYTDAYEKFGSEWLWTKNDKGEVFDWNKFEGTGKVNRYLIFDKNGKLDVLNFLKQAVLPVEAGGKLPHIPLDTILRFHYEYHMEKVLKKLTKDMPSQNMLKWRREYRQGKMPIYEGHKKVGEKEWTKYKPIQQIKSNEYFPKRYGFNKKARREINNYIDIEAQRIYDAEFKKTGSKKKAEKAMEIYKAKMHMAVEGSIAESSGIETHILDEIAARIDYEKLSASEIANRLHDIGAFTRPDSSIERVLDLPVGFDTSPEVINKYMKQIIRSHYKLLGAAMSNYRIDSMIKNQAFETDLNGNKVKYTKEQLAKLKEDGYRNHTDVWADYLRFYVRDSFGHQTTFPQRIVDSMGKNDSLKLKKNFYYLTSDQAIINSIESLNKKWIEKTGHNFPLLRGMPKGNSPEIQKAKAEFYSRVIHKWGGLEARFQLLTLLANTGTATANVFGGQTMNISSAGFRNVARSHNMKWLTKNVLLDKKGKPTIHLENGDPVKDRKSLYKWIAEQGAIDSFIKNEFELNDGLKVNIGKEKLRSLNNFRKELTKLLKSNPDARDETLMELAKRYGVSDLMLKAGGSFMQGSERYLRTISFMSHALQARDAFGKHGADIKLDDPYVVDMGLKGIENTQYLYHSAFRPAFMRTSLGKVLTRFKLFAFQSVRIRKEYYKMAKQMGFEDDAQAMKKFKNLMTADLLTLALGSIYKYSLFDTALPPPWDWAQETGEWLFGTKRDKERAFFGTYPYPLAPLQVITPPVARVPMAIFSAALNNDWDRFMDYHLHTMYPFGRIVRNLDRVIYDKDAGPDIINEIPSGTTFGRFMKQFFRMPVNKIMSRHKRDQLKERRTDYMEQLMEAI